MLLKEDIYNSFTRRLLLSSIAQSEFFNLLFLFVFTLLPSLLLSSSSFLVPFITSPYISFSIDNVVSINVGMLSINTTVDERPTLRPYRNYYVFSEGGHFFAIEIPHELPEEEVAKLEAMFYFYSRFVRMQGIRPGEESKIEKNAAGKGTGVVASVIEGGAKSLAKVFIVTGTGVAKGAKK
jgi:hypothetical protein